MRPRLQTTLAVVSLLASLAACAKERGVAGEIVVLDQRLTFERGPAVDEVSREVIAPAAGTCVAFVGQDDTDLVLEMQATASGAAPVKIEVDSGLSDQGPEIAALAVTRGSRISIRVVMTHDRPTPAQIAARIACYASTTRSPEAQARAAAYRAWSEAALRGSSSEEATRRNLELMDIAIARLESPAGDARMAAWAHLVKGCILTESMTAPHLALAEMRLAVQAFEALKPAEPRNVARAKYNLADALAQLMDDGTSIHPTAEEAKDEARRILTEISADSSPMSAAERSRAIKYLGLICYRLTDYACATRYLQAAADLARTVGYRPEESSALASLAAVEVTTGDTASAVRDFERVLPLFDKNYNASMYFTTHYNAGIAYTELGDTSKAIAHLLIALQVARQREAPRDLGSVMFGLGYVYWQRGDVAQAEIFFNESLRQRRIASERPALVNTLATVGRLARENGRLDEALAMHREALELAATPDTKMFGRRDLALDYAAMGDHDKAIEYCRLALKETVNGDQRHRANTQLTLAENLLAGHPGPAMLTEAETLAKEVLKLALARSNPFLEIGARQLQGSVYVARGDLKAARREFETTLAIIFDFRSSIASAELQAAALQREQQTFRDYADLLMRRAVARGAGSFTQASADEEAALRVFELARSGGASPARDPRLDAATQAHVNELLQQMAAKRVRLVALSNRANPDLKALAALQVDMAQLRAEIDGLRGGRDDHARVTRLPASVNRPWPALAPGATQLSYALGRRNAYLWARDERGLRVEVLAESPERLERSLAAFNAIDKVRAPAALERKLEALSAELLPPDALDNASHSLEVVAEGVLGTLPFAALRAPGSGRRLVETHDVRMITSMFDQGEPQPAASRQMAFVGVAGLSGEQRSAGHVFSSLGAARAEARTIAELFRGGGDAARIKLLTAADGDADTIRSFWAGGADTVHFATHGLANLRYPSASLLLLPKAAEGDAAYLTAGQVQEWRGDVGVAFLAACETAVGPARFAEGMSGLPRSFLGAGAHGVIATLWPIEDIYESQFTVEFYRRFVAGHDAALALAETQRAWLNPRPGEKPGEHLQRLATAWAHVFYATPKGR